MSGRSRRIALALLGHWMRAAGESLAAPFDGDARRAQFARHTRLAFEELGPAFVKLGQLVSVRPDMFGPHLVFEMEALQDRVPALPASRIREVIEREFGAPVDELFESFDDDPVASASIAQVHRATLRERYRPVVGETLEAGTPLAIKVVRPGVEEAIARDVAAARPLVDRLARLGPLRRFGLRGLLDEFASSLASEVDLRREAAVGDRYAFDFRDDPLMVVPRVVWPLTTRSVLTSEYIDGWRLSEITEAERAGIDGRGLALHGAQVFLRQVLELGRFHADLHPANLFVTPDGRICYLDFGIVGHTGREQRDAIAQVLVATVYGDADRAIRYSAELGLVIPEARRARVIARVDELMRSTLGGATRDVRGFAIGFLRVMNEERVAIPVGYGLLVKALVTVEGVARALYPDVDIIEEARPFATRMVAASMLSPARVYARSGAAIRAALEELTR